MPRQSMNATSELRSNNTIEMGGSSINASLYEEQQQLYCLSFPK